jgi:hypothetical protein
MNGQLRQFLQDEMGRFTDLFQRQHWAMQLASVVGGIAATAVLANAVFTTSAYAPSASGVESAPPYGFGMDIAARHNTAAVAQPARPDPAGSGMSGSAAQFAPGDVNTDGRVDSRDYSVLLSHFDEDYPPADIDRNGIVDALDMATLLANWSW